MVQKIALEEHFLAPGHETYWRTTVGNVDPKHAANLLARLTDFGEVRLKSMDEAGIARSVLSIAGPSVQIERDVATATRVAREANDFLAGEIQKRPNRYSGFAHLGMQDPRGAADELERCMRELKFCGAMINGHTHGQYLDHPSLYPFWERAEALGAPIYIHPTDPITPSPALEGVAGLRRATWEWGFETGSHALRLVFSGLFDRFPRAKVMLGHLGETLPFLLWRFDSRAKLYGVKLAKSAVRVHQAEYRGDHVGHVLGGAAQLHARRARQRPRDVRCRLSFRVGAGGGRIPRSHGAGRAVAGGHRIQQCRALSGT